MAKAFSLVPIIEEGYSFHVFAKNKMVMLEPAMWVQKQGIMESLKRTSQSSLEN